eukprot:204371_1
MGCCRSRPGVDMKDAGVPISDTNQFTSTVAKLTWTAVQIGICVLFSALVLSCAYFKYAHTSVVQQPNPLIENDDKSSVVQQPNPLIENDDKSSEIEEVSEEAKEEKRDEPSDRILVRQPDEVYDIDNKFHRPFIMDGYIHKYEKEVGTSHGVPEGITSLINSYLGPVATFKVMLEKDIFGSYGGERSDFREVTLLFKNLKPLENRDVELMCHTRTETSETWLNHFGYKSTVKDASGFITAGVTAPLGIYFGVYRCGYGYKDYNWGFKFIHSRPISHLYHERSVQISRTSSQVRLKMSALRSNHTYNLIRASTDKKDDIPFKDRFAQVKVDSSGELHYIDKSISQDSEISLQDGICYAIEDPDVEGVFEIIGRAWTSA